MMERPLKKESGYILLTVLLIITVISIIGLTFMGLTINSMKIVKVNQNTVETKTSAENGIEEAMAQINKGIDTIKANNGINTFTIDQIKSKVQNSLDGIRSLGPYPYTIQRSTIRDGSDGVYMEKVTITAPIGSTGKSIKKTITISTIANVFKYGAVTPGVLTLNGASYIEGDILVGDTIQSSNYGRFSFGGTYYPVQTSFPAINGTLNVLKNNFKVYSNNSWQTFSPTPANLNSYFSIAPKITSSSLAVDTINVSDLITKKSVTISSTKSNKLSSLTVKSTDNLTYNGNLVINGDLIVNSGGKLTINNGSLRVSGAATLSGTISLNNKNNYIYIEGYTKIQNNLTLNGAMYINNKADILNDLNTNGSIYVKNDVTVQKMSNSSGTLVLLTDGNLQVSNNNEFIDDPKIVNAFFYSNQTLEMYGVGSNIKILGGIYGNQIILNSVKGKSSDNTAFTNSFSVAYSYIDYYIWMFPHYTTDYYYFQKNQDTIDPTKSRLSIIYQKDIILNPPTGIPTAQDLTVKEIDTVYP